MNCQKCHKPMIDGHADGRPVHVCLKCNSVIFRQTTGLMDQQPPETPRGLVTIPVEKRSKFGNVKTERDGVMFDSKREADRYSELKLMEAAGEIANLLLQPSYDLVVNGIKVGKYIADFAYYHKTKNVYVIEDAKGVKTAVYKLKKRIMAAMGYVITEV